MRNETSSLDIFNNEKSLEYLDAARTGNRAKEKELYIALKNSVKTIGYSFYGSAMKLGISLTDIDDLTAQAFIICFNKYDDKLGSLLSYYRIIYTNLIKELIRTNCRNTKRMEIGGLGENNDIFENETIPDESTQNKVVENINSTEIVNYVLDRKNCPELTNEEREIIFKFTNNYSFKEISEELHVRYNIVISNFKRGINKIRKKYHIKEGDKKSIYVFKQLTK